MVRWAAIVLLALSGCLAAAADNYPSRPIRLIVTFPLAKQKPVAIGLGGSGTAMDRLFAHMAGISMTLVPYHGTGPATQDLVAGHIPLAITDPPTAVSLIQSKQIKVLAVTTKES
jgi:tripartite-type tricarboxylate transporter receptor subunit TctC